MLHKRKIYFTLGLFFVLLNLNAQNISVSQFESTNNFYGADKSPYIKAASSSILKMRLRPHPICYFDAGIYANIGDVVNFFNPVNKIQNTSKGNFGFSGASLNFPNMGGQIFFTSIFTGLYDNLGSDSLLQELIKTKIEDPKYRKYYPGNSFKPQNHIKGTGTAIYGAFKQGFYLGTYTYWNEQLKKNAEIKTDIRMGGKFDFFSFDFFSGITVPFESKDFYFRSGILMLFDTDYGYNFFAEVGVANMLINKISAENLNRSIYASFETRIKKENFSTSISFFLSPVFLLPVWITDESLQDSFYVGVSNLITFGNIEKYNMEGGVLLLGSINPKKPALITPFSFSIAPFYTLKLEKFELDFRVPVNPLMYKNIKQMFNVQFSIKAVY